MPYKHGAYKEEKPTSLVPMTETDGGLIVAIGTAPVHLAKDPAGANKPVLCSTYTEAVEAFGYSDDFEKYTLCEAIKTQFGLFNMAPIVLINLLDVTNSDHVQQKNRQEVALQERVGEMSDPVLLNTLKLFPAEDSAAEAELKLNEDYTVAHDDDGNVVITALEGAGAASLNKVYADYKAVKPAGVTPSHVVGGIDVDTGAAEGLELIDEIYPRFGMVPGIIIAPGFSENTEVAATIKAKCDNIDGCFSAIGVVDLPTSGADCVRKYSDAFAYKTQNNIVDTSIVATWPMLTLAGQKYHLSTQLASVMNQTDSEKGSDIPYFSPSNKSLQCDGACLKDGTEVFLSNVNAGILNGYGIVTAINGTGGWTTWGNRTTVYPANTDVKDSFISLRRMFNWVGNTLITTFWSKIDDPTNRRLIDSIVNSANVWLNSLTAQGALLGGRVEFLEEDNSITDLMDGKIRFHVYMTPPSPAREITFVQEYDPAYISTLFAA